MALDNRKVSGQSDTTPAIGDIDPSTISRRKAFLIKTRFELMSPV